MLTFGRKENETIVLGLAELAERIATGDVLPSELSDVTITVQQCARAKTRLSITAPRCLIVDRGEIYFKRRAAENRHA